MEKIALIGANGMLAFAIKRNFPERFNIYEYDLPEFDLTNKNQVMSLKDKNFDIIINCAAYTNVDNCEIHKEFSIMVNGEGPGFLAELARDTGASLVHISTDFVFSGDKTKPYVETDKVGPISVYGIGKELGEQRIINSGLKKYFIIRTSWLYGIGGKNFVADTIIKYAKEREVLKVVNDQIGTPTFTDDLSWVICYLLCTDKYGVYHFSNEGECSWYDFAREIVEQNRVFEHMKVKKVIPVSTEEGPEHLASRPKYSVLSKDKICETLQINMPMWKNNLWQNSLKQYLIQRHFISRLGGL